MNRNLKIFLLNGIPAGLVMGILFGSLYGADAGFWSGLATGLASGASLYFALGFLHSRAVGKIRGGNNADALTVCHGRSIRLPVPFDSAYRLCLAALRQFRGCAIQHEDRGAGKITATTSINWKTWGDRISITLEKVTDDHTLVEVVSRPSSWMTLVDYGKNLYNVITIGAFLEEAGETLSPGSPEEALSGQQESLLQERINGPADQVA